MQSERVAIAKLVFDPVNARKHGDKNMDAIKGSLARFGQQKPIVVGADNVVYAGNGTLAAAKALGWTEIDVVRTQLTGPDAIAFALADNRSAELAEWDTDVLGKTLESLRAIDFDVGSLGFDDDFMAIGASNDTAADAAAEPDADDEPAIPANVPRRVNLGETWQLGRHRLVCGDSSKPETLATLGAAAHALVSDPPYGLSFMGKAWDYDVPKRELWTLWLAALEPGAHLLVFGGTRTYHRMVCALEDSGAEIRDQMQWLYGQGFPKSLDVSKAIDKAAEAERDVIGKQSSKYSAKPIAGSTGWEQPARPQEITAPATDAAKQWDGWGTALKPANEPVCVARKPLAEKTVAANVLKYGTGALSIDDSRVSNAGYASGGKNEGIGVRQTPGVKQPRCDGSMGRFPANVILDEEAAAALDEQSGISKSPKSYIRQSTTTRDDAISYNRHIGEPAGRLSQNFGDSGGASRFFYVAKASTADRGEGNTHATVKPLRLMEYLVALVTAEGQTVLEPFAGSGTTLLACETKGRVCFAAELSPEHCDIILARWEKFTGQIAKRLDA